MTNEPTISRRTVLAGLGSIGIASAGAGLGTTAYFRDEESVAAELDAGRVDLLVDFRATYETWLNEADTADVVNGPALPDPSADAEMRYVVGQAPDWRADADGTPLTGDEWGDLTKTVDACAFADTTDVRAEVAADADRPETVEGTPGDDDSFYPGYVDGAEGLLFDLTDVKPKDRGEATVSLHLCDNPAYLWAQAVVDENTENVAYEPETSAGDDDSPVGELADYLHVSVWDDSNCNNRRDAGEDVDVAILFDTSGSMNETTPGAGLNDAPEKLASVKEAVVDLAGLLTSESRVTVYAFDDEFRRLYDLQSPVPGAIESAVAGETATGGTVYSEVIEDAADYLNTSPAARPDARKVVVFLGDGGPKDEPDGTSPTGGTNPSPGDGTTDEDRQEALDAVDAATGGSDPLVDEFYTIAYETAGDTLATDLLTEMATSPGAAFAADEPGIETAFRQIGRAIRGDVLLYEGSLGGLVTDPTLGGAVPLDSLQIDDCALADPAEATAFPAGVHCVAFEWYLPCDAAEAAELGSCWGAFAGSEADESMLDELVAREVIAGPDDFDVNVVQTDGLRFGARFAAVQSRHNATNASPFGPPAA
jgi:predicted ribosomally synthesized peptide with SipW-like signal peptide